MKILYVITQADGGGAQKYVLALARHFKGAIAAGSEDTKLFQEAQTANLEIFPLKHLKRNIHLWHDLLAVFELRRLYKKFAPDIVHLNSTKAGFLGSLAGAGLRPKIIFTAHGFRYLEPLSPANRWFYRLVEKLAGYFRDFIIAVSETDKKSALQNHLITHDKIITIHNGVPTISFRSPQEARSELGLNTPDHTKIIGAIANDYATKGVDVLEKAAALTKSDALIIVRGHGPRKVSQDGKFAWQPYQNQVACYLKAFDILTIPSRKEGLPFLLLEAMQAGLPIVATKVGGIPEALGEAGLLVEPENPEELARALDTLVANPDLAQQLGQKAAERAKLFTEEKMLKETENVYKKIYN